LTSKKEALHSGHSSSLLTACKDENLKEELADKEVSIMLGKLD
jgi:hypothetical protein